MSFLSRLSVQDVASDVGLGSHSEGAWWVHSISWVQGPAFAQGFGNIAVLRVRV